MTYLIFIKFLHCENQNQNVTYLQHSLNHKATRLYTVCLNLEYGRKQHSFKDVLQSFQMLSNVRMVRVLIYPC